ncbi:hypothetical protein HN789_03630 [archaeon]|jgi:hypothetical protein|nr:hypothetical protein [archaeon]MBT4272451.1 hypothetical protein [archaeon]MBT4460549.1 hypothetical protein [archaeon]MBT4857861.1 hypothetical protein [archaeon]MBT5423124.1 hypothetical protein [archaeon]
MEVDKNIFWIAGIVTLFLFGLIYFTSEVLNTSREAKLNTLRDEVINEIENMKAFTAISDLIGESQNCELLETQLNYFDKSIWDLGKKLDSYESVSKNIFDDPFYKTQKKRFNVNQIFYLSVHEKMKRSCNTSLPVTIIYFYGNSKECSDCDAQSFVLTDINKDIDEEISIFSLDVDLDVMAIAVLKEYHNVTNLPCTVIEGKTYCGIKDRKEILNLICTKTNLSVC